MISIWIAGAGIAIMGIVAYALGYHACNKQWIEDTTDLVNQMLEQKVNEVKEMYSDVYRDIVHHLVELISEELDNEDDTE